MKALYKFLFISFLFLSCNSQTLKVQIGYQQISLYQHVFTAYEKGFFKDEGLDVQLTSFASGNQIMSALLSNQINVAGLTNMEVGLTIEGKDPGKFKFVNFLVWGKNTFPDYIIVRKDAGIKTMKDLEGKTVGLHPGSAVRGFSSAVFDHFNLDKNKISTIELKPDIMQSAITARRVEALYCMDPVATDLLYKGDCEILLANPLGSIFDPPIPISGSAVSTDFISNNPEVLEKIINALDRAIRYIEEPGHEDEIAGYISEYTPISKELALKMNPSEYWLYNEIDSKRVQKLADKFYELQISDKKIAADKLLINNNQ